jgi:hypothetical protein
MSLDATPAPAVPQRQPLSTPARGLPAGTGVPPASVPGQGEHQRQALLGNAAMARAARPPPGAAGVAAALGNAAAGRAAVAPAAAPAAGGLGGPTPVGSATASCPYPLPDRTLFGQLQRRWPLFGQSIDVPLWRASVDLGWLGWIDLSLIAGASAEASVWTSLGPGVLRDICLSGDPFEACVTGTGLLHVPAVLAPDLRLEGTLRGAAKYLGSIPLAALSGALVATGAGTAHADLTMAVTVTYENDEVSLDTETDLALAVALAFGLDASLIAELFGEQVYAGRWNLIDWRWARDWDILGRLALGVRGNVLTDPRFQFQPAEIALDEVLRSLFRGLVDPKEIVSGIRGSMVATSVPLLDPMAAVVARGAIEAGERPLALEIVVRALPLDRSLFTISFDDSDTRREGRTTTTYLPGDIPSGPSTVLIHPRAFTSVQWLVTTVMHEYTHAVQHQRGWKPGETETDATLAATSKAREVEAYLWEIEHAEDTGLIAQDDNLRDTARRLRWQFKELGTLDRGRQDEYRARVDAALDFVDDVLSVRAPDLPPFANIFHHGTDYDQAMNLKTDDIRATGGNDFGLGFYTHSRENWALAKEWAIRRSRKMRGWGVVTFPVPDDVWKAEIFKVMVFENPDHQPENIPINPDTGRKFKDWTEFVDYNKSFRRDELPGWTTLQVIFGPLWGRYQDDPRVRQIVFTSTGVPVLNRRESRRHRIVHVRLFRSRGAQQ